jgi:hypothetical protein
MVDNPVNNYLGDRSLYNNLKLIKNPVRVNKLLPEHRRKIFYGLKNTLPKSYLDKAWELITSRYSYLKSGGYIIET